MIPETSPRLKPEYQGTDSILVASYDSGMEKNPKPYFILSGSPEKLKEGLKTYPQPADVLKVLRTYHGANPEAESLVRREIRLANERKQKSLDFKSLDKELLDDSVKVVQLDTPVESRLRIVQ